MRSMLIVAGLLLIFLGFFVVIAGILLQVIEQPKEEEKEVRGGALIFIGPIPIAFGTDKESLIVVSILMIVLMVVVWFLFSGWR